MIPFFSVCIPTYNRGNTIFNTLNSLCSQTFKNFEVKIVDCGSDDNTREEISRFFVSKAFEKNHFEYEYICKNYSPRTIEDWNEPVRLAKGKYIAMLEGDDQFLPDHLNYAYQYLSNHSNIGIYATGNTVRHMPFYGFMKAKDYFNYIYSLRHVPPPSEAIFIRENKVPYYYNEENFVYAPEIDLYLRISKDGFDAFHDKNDTVYRYPSSIKLRDSWLYYHDHFLILKKYKNPLSFKKIRNNIYGKIRLMIIIISVYKESNSKSFKKDVIENCGYFSVYILLLVRFIYRKFKFIVKK